MSSRNRISIAWLPGLSVLSLASWVEAQDPKGIGPDGQFFEKKVLQTAGGREWRHVVIGKPTKVPGEGYTETRIDVEFGPRAALSKVTLDHQFVWALVSNVERGSQWRLRGAKLQPGKNGPQSWSAAALTFARRAVRDEKGGEREVTLLPMTWRCVKALDELFPTVPLFGIRTRSVELQPRDKGIVARGEVEIQGASCHRVFATLEHVLAQACVAANSPFQRCRLANGEVPLPDAKGGVFTFELEQRAAPEGESAPARRR